jgi:hypothetical protein
MRSSNWRRVAKYYLVFKYLRPHKFIRVFRAIRGHTVTIPAVCASCHLVSDGPTFRVTIIRNLISLFTRRLGRIIHVFSASGIYIISDCVTSCAIPRTVAFGMVSSSLLKFTSIAYALLRDSLASGLCCDVFPGD